MCIRHSDSTTNFGNSTKFMFHIEINHKKGKKRYPIYFLDENPEVAYKPWYEALEGEMCISDDGMISEVIKRSIYKKKDGREQYYIRTPLGSMFFHPKKKLPKFNCKDRKTSYTIDGASSFEAESRTQWFKNLAMAHAQTMNEHESIKMVFGENIGKNKKTKMRRIIRTERFKAMVREELAKLLSDKGITEGSIVDNLNEAMDLAKNKGDISNLMRGIENLQDMLGMRDKQVVKSTAQLSAVSTKQILEEINQETKAIDAKIEVIENE